jgi:hypothetical protein
MFKFVPGLCELQIGHPGGAVVGAGNWLETARTGNRRFGMLSALHAYTQAPYKIVFTMGNAKDT